MRRRVNHNAMPVVGYTTPWSAKAGESVKLHLSCVERPVLVSVRRLDAPLSEQLDWTIEPVGDPVPHRSFNQGSYLKLSKTELDKAHAVKGVSFELYLTGNGDLRTVIEAGSFALQIIDGTFFLASGDVRHEIGRGIPSRTWINVSIRNWEGSTKIELQSQDSLSPFYFEQVNTQCAWNGIAGDLLFGTDGLFDKPTLNARFAKVVLETATAVYGWNFPTLLSEHAVASTGGSVVLFLGLINLPTICVTSARWDGTTFDPRLEPSHYDAVHCHDDDMGSLGWPASYVVMVPEAAPCGVYTFDVQCARQSEEVIFFVASSQVRNPIVFVVPTATYLAYADEVLPEHLYEWKCDDRGHRLAVDNNFKSLYDYHSDLSGVSICSFEKPKATIRTDYRYPLGDCPHNLPVDLHFLRFCHKHHIDFDLITDHDLHNRGPEALYGYRGVVTGSHPEYLSIEMENTYRQFAANGGNIAYMGGNGFAGTVAFKGDLMELRRSPLEAGRTWDAPIAEQSFSITNQPAGYLRSRGRGEFTLVGGAISLMGFDGARPFTRSQESFDPVHGWLFEGVESSIFGHDGIVLGGAAGYEVDATDQRLGTSPDTIILARAAGFPDSFYHDSSRWYEGGNQERIAHRCAELTVRYLITGGLIFSASSVAWLGALPSGENMNDVGRITLNLLTRIASRSGEEIIKKSGSTNL